MIGQNGPVPEAYARWRWIRRGTVAPGDGANFACGGPPATTLEEPVRIAGIRWANENLFEVAKGDCGLDEYEVRSWVGWHRHATLSLLSLAAVAVIRPRAGEARATNRTGGPQSASPAGVGRPHPGRAGAGVVRVASPVPGAAVPLPLPRSQTAELTNYG